MSGFINLPIEFQRWYLNRILNLSIIYTLAQETAHDIHKCVTEHFLKERNSKQAADRMLRFIDEGIELGMLDIEDFKSTREFLSIISST